VKTAFVTGGSSDIGQEIIRKLRAQDWDVIAPGHKQLDLSDLDALSSKVDELVRDTPTLDAVVHVAGVWHDDQTAFRKDLEDYTPKQIAETMNVGLTGFMIVLSKLLPKLPQDGTVIGISGTFSDGASGWLPYYTSKRGLEDMLAGLAHDYPSGPKVFGISPADTVTKAYERFFPEYVSEAQPAAAVAKAVADLIVNPNVESGTVVELRNSSVQPGFHQ
jgi:NAD(P)-dependent dehydrogenase (short-subunit alcohol dehydrogenase family)